MQILTLAPTPAKLRPVSRFPVLLPDREVSRNLRRHFLTIPGEPASFAFNTVEQAIESIVAHGFTEFILHVGTDDYRVTPCQRSLLDVAGAVDGAADPFKP